MANQHNISSVTKSSPWTKFSLEDQLLKHQDGYVFNLSDIDWNAVDVYEYESSNSSQAEYDIVSVGRSFAVSIFAVIFLVGLLGNALVIYTVGRYPAMRRGAYLYLLNLSVADMLYVLVCLPTLSVSYALVDWRLGRVFCKLENYIMSVSMSVSVLTIVATGLDRYIAVIYPLRSRTFRTTQKTVSVITLTWILSLVIMAPRITIYDEVSVWHIVGLTTQCSRIQSDHILQLDTTLNFVFMYLLPLLGLSACHSRIGQRLWTSRRPGFPPAQTGQIGTLLVRDKRRIAMMVFAITVVFAIGWLPIHVYHLVEDFDKGNILFGEIIDRGTIALFFSFGANALNPIFYCLFSSSFRKHFKKTFQCWCDRSITSINLADARFIKFDIAQVEGRDYRLPPPVMLPRPASLLPSSVKLVENRLPSFSKVAYQYCPSLLSPKMIRPVQSLHQASSSDGHSICSPLSTKNVTPIEVINIDLPSHSDNREELQGRSSFYPSSIGFITAESSRRKSRRFEINRSTSLPRIISRRHSRNSLIRARSKSAGDVSYESDDVWALESYQPRFEIDFQDRNRFQTSNTCPVDTGQILKQQQCRTALVNHKAGTQFSCKNTFSLSRKLYNTTAAKKINHVSFQLLGCANKINSSLIQESSVTTETNNTYALNETAVSVSKLHKCDLVSSWNGVVKTTAIKPTDCSHFGSGHVYHFIKPACNTKMGSHRVCKKRIKTHQNTNRSNNLPPVD